MKKLVLVFLFVMANAEGWTQQLSITSTNYYGGSRGENYGRVLPTADGGFLGVGSTNSDDGNIPPHSTTVLTRITVLVAKHDSLGGLHWAKTFGGTSNEAAIAATQTPDGGYAIACYTNSDDGDVTGRIGTGNLENTSDVWLLRLDASGNLLWTRTFGGSLSEGPSDVLATPDGGLILLCTSAGGDSDVVGSIGSTLFTDWLLIKLDASGNRQWRRVIGGTSNEGGESRLFNAPGGGYYLVGNSLSHDSDLTEDNVWPGSVAPSSGPVFLRLTDTGTVVWCKRYGGSGSHSMYAAALDSRDTSLLAAGYTRSNEFYFSGNHPYPNGQPSFDMYLVKVDKNGDFIQSGVYGTGNDEEARGIGLGPNNEQYLLTGVASGGFPAPPGFYGGLDIGLIMISPNGQAQKVIGTSGNDEARSALYRNGKWLVIGGVFIPPLNEGTTNPGGHPQGNIFVSNVVYDPTGVTNLPAEGRANLQLIPNPASRSVECRFLSGTFSGKLVVYDAAGKVRYQTVLEEAEKLTIPVGNWAKGSYTVVASDRNSPRTSTSQLTVF